LLAALGFGYIFLIFAGVCGIVWGLRQILAYADLEYLSRNLNQVTFVLVLGIIQLFWVNFPPPRGVEVTRQEVPELFTLIDELTDKLKAPKFHRILLNNQQNAGVLQVPRFGILFMGWQQNYLFLGLPLMQSLSPEQFRAIVAHELGHLSGNHSRFSGWIYTLRNTWFNLIERFQSNGRGGSFLFSHFFNWYGPFFRAYTFVLARSNEYEADRCAAELAGAYHAAQALINVEIKGSFFQKYLWEKVYKQTVNDSQPPKGTITQMLHQLANPIPLEDAKIWLDLALHDPTNNEDTHPCLRDRLDAFGYLPLGYDLPLPPPVQVTAAEHFLGKELTSLAQRLDVEWQKEITPVWQLLHQKAQRRSQNLKTLEAKAKTHSLTIESTWKLAQLTAEFKGNTAAIPLDQQVIDQQPQHSAANFDLGRILLAEKDETGIQFIETAMASDPELIISGCKILYEFCQRQGKIETAKSYQKRIEQNFSSCQQARKERQAVSYLDKFLPHNLPDMEIGQIAAQISTYPQIKAAYFARKVVTHFPEKPCYILVIMRRFVRSEVNNYLSDPEFLDLLLDDLNFSGEVIGVVINHYNINLREVLRKIPGASIYLS